jgi:3-deoxy-D-manno-octulosonic acid kinase
VTAFEERRQGARFLRVAPEFARAAEALGLPDPRAVAALLEHSVAPRGRGATAIVELPDTGVRMHLRPVRHGGLFGGLLGRTLYGLGRPIGELEVTAALRAAGVPVPAPVLVVGERLRGPLWCAAVGTVHEEETRDGVALLDAGPERARMLAAAEAAGRAVRRFHDAGGSHFDLHVKNLLFRETAHDTEALVIDLDRARIHPSVSASRRMKELMRLYRSLVKRDLLRVVGGRGCARFFGSYTARDRALRRALLSHLTREQRRVRLHALAYGRG